ncbi:unnamed protein product [Penicillium salamii]|nr:unnamed protein product [Penicillium salamii]CAG8278257.1 unnamed protein product [Penicillium salamii]
MAYKQRQEKTTGTHIAAVLPDDKTPWYKKGNLLRLNFCLFCLFLFSSTNGYDGFMMNGLQALPQWHKFMKAPTGVWLGFINAIQSLGAIVCYPTVAWSNKRLGQKESIAAGCFWLGLGVGLQSLAQSPLASMIGRLLIGGGFIGSVILAWATYGSQNYVSCWAWRIPWLLQMAIPAVTIYGLYIPPEIPRWLVAMKRFEEGRSMLIKHHAGYYETSTLVEFEFEEITRIIAFEEEFAETASYADMFHKSTGLVSYYLAPTFESIEFISVSNQTMISGFFQIWNLIFAVVAAFSVNRVGCHLIFIASCLDMLVFIASVSVLSSALATTGIKATETAVPYSLRARSLLIDLLFTQLAVLFNIFVNPITLKSIEWRFYFVYLALLVIILFAIFIFYPETEGHSLEGMSMVLDGSNDAVIIDFFTVHSIAMRRASASTKNAGRSDEDI